MLDLQDCQTIDVLLVGDLLDEPVACVQPAEERSASGAENRRSVVYSLNTNVGSWTSGSSRCRLAIESSASAIVRGLRSEPPRSLALPKRRKRQLHRRPFPRVGKWSVGTTVGGVIGNRVGQVEETFAELTP